MSTNPEEKTRKARSGIRISLINTVLIVLGLVFSAGIISSSFRTELAFRSIHAASDSYMVSQQATGMLDSLSASMENECRAFLADGDPSHAHSFSGMLDTLNAQLSVTDDARSRRAETEADAHLDSALNAFREMNALELRAMRLSAETLRVPMAAYPEILQKEELSEEDLALPPEEKKETASALLSSEAFAAWSSLMKSEIDTNHRLNAEVSRSELDENEKTMNRVTFFQKFAAFLFILFAVIAFVVNHVLIIRPIRRSVSNLDRREEIPVRGSYEIRRLADAYNSLREENSRKQEALAYTAAHDALTDVLNRGAFEDIYHSADLSGYGALIIADVDHFKIYNDNHGHDTGDRVLQAVARAIREHIRPEDLLYRIGGDEFVILLKNATRADADKLLERIDRINEKLSAGEDGVPCLTISAGIAFREDLQEGGDLFKCADTALLQVKDRGRRGGAVYKGQE